MGRGCFRLLVLSLMLPGLAGCFRSAAQPQYYLLTAAAPSPGRAQASSTGPLIGLGPVRIPAYLDRDPIVTAVSNHEYKFSDDHRWAERLEVTLARVSVENLSRMIPSERILLHPWPREAKPDIQVAIDVQDFYVDAAGIARLDALWTLRDVRGSGDSRRFSCSLPASTNDYGVMVDAQSRCLARLNSAIAEAIRHAPSYPGPH